MHLLYTPTIGTSVPFFGEVICRHGIQPNWQKLKAFTEMPLSKAKKECQAFLRIINYLGKLSPSTADSCKFLRNWHHTKKSEPGIQHTRICLTRENQSGRRYMHGILWWNETTMHINRWVWDWTRCCFAIDKKNRCPRDEATDNSIPRPNAITSKSLTGAEKKI